MKTLIQLKKDNKKNMSNFSVLQLPVKHWEKICSVFGGYFISMNIPPQKQDEMYTYL
jgi:hypothetical protein